MAEIVVPHEDTWERLRDVRLRALTDAPDAFGSTYDTEAQQDEAAWREWLTGWTGASDQALFAAVEKEAWVGISLGVRWSAKPRVVHIYAMWVDPSHRRRGVGRALMDAVLGWAHDRGATKARLNVNEENTAAVALYRAAAFGETEERQSLREGASTCLVTMWRAL